MLFSKPKPRLLQLGGTRRGGTKGAEIFDGVELCDDVGGSAASCCMRAVALTMLAFAMRLRRVGIRLCRRRWRWRAMGVGSLSLLIFCLIFFEAIDVVCLISN